MFDIGGWEFLIIMIVAIVVVGPKELPGLVRTVAEWIRRARGMAQEFRSGLDDLAREVELEKIGDDVTRRIGLDETVTSIRDEIENTIDPKGEIAEAFIDDGHMLDEHPLDSDEEFELDDDAEELYPDPEELYPDGEEEVLPAHDDGAQPKQLAIEESGTSADEEKVPVRKS